MIVWPDDGFLGIEEPNRIPPEAVNFFPGADKQ